MPFLAPEPKASEPSEVDLDDDRKLCLTTHAKRRSRTRNVPRRAIELAIDHGRSWRQTNQRTAYFVGKRDVVLAGRSGVDLSAAKHVAVVVSDEGVVWTVIRTSDARRLRRLGYRYRDCHVNPG